MMLRLPRELEMGAPISTVLAPLSNLTHLKVEHLEGAKVGAVSAAAVTESSAAAVAASAQRR